DIGREMPVKAVTQYRLRFRNNTIGIRTAVKATGKRPASPSIFRRRVRGECQGNSKNHGTKQSHWNLLCAFSGFVSSACQSESTKPKAQRHRGWARHYGRRRSDGASEARSLSFGVLMYPRILSLST